jgi:YbbR domain-containing protein
VQDYTINLQYTLPDDFHSWSSSTTAVTIDYSGTTDASFVSSIRANDSGSILATTSSQSGSGLSTTFSSLNLATSSQLSSLSAGDKITIAVRAHVTSAANIGDSIIRLGDITLNYNRNVL